METQKLEYRKIMEVQDCGVKAGREVQFSNFVNHNYNF